MPLVMSGELNRISTELEEGLVSRGGRTSSGATVVNEGHELITIYLHHVCVWVHSLCPEIQGEKRTEKKRERERERT